MPVTSAGTTSAHRGGSRVDERDREIRPFDPWGSEGVYHAVGALAPQTSSGLLWAFQGADGTRAELAVLTADSVRAIAWQGNRVASGLDQKPGDCGRRKLGEALHKEHDRQPLKAFGARVRTLRRAKALSQEEMALSSGLERAYVGGVERGERNVSLLNIYKIADALGVTPKELFQ
jgi:DNA-binding XRE family transcriptional regulator